MSSSWSSSSRSKPLMQSSSLGIVTEVDLHMPFVFLEMLLYRLSAPRPAVDTSGWRSVFCVSSLRSFGT